MRWHDWITLDLLDCENGFGQATALLYCLALIDNNRDSVLGNVAVTWKALAHPVPFVLEYSWN
jgi:hypothetical protein